MKKQPLKETYERMFGTLNEAKEEKVYMLNGMLWLSYSPNSGRTTRIRGRGWITDKSSEKNFDSGVKGFAKWSQYQKPIKKKTASNGSKVSLFKIPEYSGGDAKEYDIWGGNEKPKKWRYLLVSLGKKINVISVFHSKAEAMSWIGHTAENVNEAIEPEGIMAKIQSIVQKKQHQKIGGMLVDLFTANGLLTIFNALNDTNKAKMNKMKMPQLANIITKAWKKGVLK